MEHTTIDECPVCSEPVKRPFHPSPWGPHVETFTHHVRGRQWCRIGAVIWEDGSVNAYGIPDDMSMETFGTEALEQITRPSTRAA